jgi:hypothetical protein
MIDDLLPASDDLFVSPVRSFLRRPFPFSFETFYTALNPLVLMCVASFVDLPQQLTACAAAQNTLECLTYRPPGWRIE